MNLSDRLTATAQRLQDKPAVITGARMCTYAQLEQAAQRTASELGRAGVGPGHKVALTSANGPEFIAAFIGILRCGAVAVPSTADIQAPECSAMLELVRCEYQLTVGRPPVETAVRFRAVEDAAAVDLFLARTGINGTGPIAAERPFGGLRHNRTCPGPPVDHRLVELNASSIRFTSGTTAFFKGVVLSHEGIAERIEVANRALKISQDDTIFFALQMAHHFAVSVMLHLSVGATIVTGGAFLGDTMTKTIRRHRVTVIYGTPVTYRTLADAPNIDAMSGVRLALSTAMPLSPEIEQHFEQQTGVPLSQALGIIEVGMPIMNLSNPRPVRGSLGRLVDGFAARVVAESGTDVTPGEPGELWLRGPGMLAAYYAPWQSREQILHEGWFRTGDVVRRDRGDNFFLLGRCKDVINVGGIKVFPVEVEQALAACDGVAEVLVTAAPDHVLGEIPTASVVLRPGSQTSVQMLVSHCQRLLSSFKVPRTIRIVPALPRTHSGKIARSKSQTDTTSPPQ